MTSAVIYARISQDDGRALGVTRQEDDCRAFCERRGWDIAEVLIDNDISAYSGRRRPGYDRLLTGLDDGEWDVLVVWHPDRLHRRPIELEQFIDVVESSGVAVATVTAGDWDLATPEGRLMARIVGSVARKESEDRSRRLRRKHEEIAKQGGVAGGGRRPFGYEPDRVTTRETEADEIRRAVDRVLAGDSVRSVVRDWNARGVPSVSGAMWSATTVKRMLWSARISGQREHRGVITGPAVWPAIIPPDQTVALRALLRSEPRARPARSYLLSGWVYCAVCRARMMSRPQRNRGGKWFRRYVCSSDRGGCGRCGVIAEGLESMVARELMDRLDREDLASREVESGRGGGRDEVAEVESRMVELAEMFAAGAVGRAEWMAARGALERRLAEARDGHAREVRASAVTLALLEAGDVASEFGDWSIDRQRAVLGLWLGRVDVGPANPAVNRFDPDRVDITWAR